MKIGSNCALCKLHKNNPESPLKFYGGGYTPLIQQMLGWIHLNVCFSSRNFVFIQKNLWRLLSLA